MPNKERREGCKVSFPSLPHKKRAPTMALMIQGSRKNRAASFAGRRRRRRKRKQLELPQAVSKCALRRRGGDNRTPPKPLKGPILRLRSCDAKGIGRRSFGFNLLLADASPLRSFEILLSFARFRCPASPYFGLTPSCVAASECFCKQAFLARGGRANRQPIAASR